MLYDSDFQTPKLTSAERELLKLCGPQKALFSDAHVTHGPCRTSGRGAFPEETSRTTESKGQKEPSRGQNWGRLYSLPGQGVQVISGK